MERPVNRHLVQIILPFLVITMLYCSKDVSAQTYSRFNDMIYRAYVDNHMGLWESTLQTMEFQYVNRPDPDLLYDILLAQYGLIGYYLGTDQKQKASVLLRKAESYLEKLEEVPGFEAQSSLFKAAFNAFHIGLRPIRSIQLGPPSYGLINRGIEQDPHYARGYIEKGNLLYYAPAVFGGSKSKALEFYLKAIEMMEANMPYNQRWLYLGTLVSVSNAYRETGDTQSAIAILKKALTFEPDFLWVRDELLPELLKKP